MFKINKHEHKDISVLFKELLDYEFELIHLDIIIHNIKVYYQQ